MPSNKELVKLWYIPKIKNIMDFSPFLATNASTVMKKSKITQYTKCYFLI